MNSLAAVLRINKSNAAGNSKKVVHPWCSPLCSLVSSYWPESFCYFYLLLFPHKLPSSAQNQKMSNDCFPFYSKPLSKFIGFLSRVQRRSPRSTGSQTWANALRSGCSTKLASWPWKVQVSWRKINTIRFCRLLSFLCFLLRAKL